MVSVLDPAEDDEIDRPRRAEYTPRDFLNFRESGSLNITPKFQRRDVWKLPHRSYFIDSLIRGLPVPPIYLREVQSVDFRNTVREVIDGQQRISAVLDYIDGKYSISRATPAPWSGFPFDALSESHQLRILDYHFACETFSGISDATVLNMFSRLNTYSVQLNKQELRNGRWFGHFKQCSYELAYEYLEFWRSNRIFTEDAIARMLEVELTSELLILEMGGLQDKKHSIDEYYADLDEAFPERKRAVVKFNSVMEVLSQALSNVLPTTNFRRVPLFYSLFGAVYHRMYGLPGLDIPTSRSRMTTSDRSSLAQTVELLSAYVDAEHDNESVPKRFQSFVVACLRQTDNLAPRMRRLETIYREADL